MDLTSLSALTTAFTGLDAIVSLVGTEGLAGQTILFDAAVAAGVKHFLPSEFGSDISVPAVGQLPVFAFKVAVRNHIEAAVASGAKITYTYVINSAFLDWGLEYGLFLDWKNGSASLYDGGSNVFSASLLSDIGDAVVGVLLKPEETKNRSVYVESVQTSQTQLLAIAKKLLPGKEWTETNVKIDDVVAKSYEGLGKGDYSMGVMMGFLVRSIWGGRVAGQPWAKNDNELLGVKGLSEKELEEVFRKIVEAAK